MKRRDLWYMVRGRAHVIFPVAGVLLAALILTSPLHTSALVFLCTNSFARFCMFWCLAVCTVLSFSNRLVRPAKVAVIATAVAVVVGAAFFAIYVNVLGKPDVSTFFLSCLSGAVLGALAGTWLVYVLEVYTNR